jgi:membrane glycosyltransferase
VTPSRLATIKTSEHGASRRLLLLVLVVTGTVAALQILTDALASDGLSISEIGLIVAFFLTFSWISFAFWTATAGFLSLLLARRRAPWAIGLSPPADGPLPGRTAIVMPIYHEDPDQVALRLRATYRSLARTGELDAFDFFILSDSRRQDVVREEEAAWARLCAELGAGGRLFYRNRADNLGRKAGNIEDFCRHWGSRYGCFVVLDADSVMAGETLVQLVRLMEANPRAGLIQTVPRPAGSTTLFARIQQFAAGLYSPMFATGFAYWYPGSSNYWGHNAIIRTAAFMACAKLPVLPGAPPLGGEILSHDFVEAALLRRGGWSVWLVPELEGSYEALPPTVSEYVKRDRRWCQGNLQHLKLLNARGLPLVSRFHLASGAMAYLASPLWLLLLVLSTLEALRAQFSEWTYFPEPGLLFPVWPIAKTFELVGLFGLTMGMLVLPRLFSLILLLVEPVRRAGFGGFARAVRNALAELVFSVLLAPILMLRQSRAVIGILLGQGVGWTAQHREGDGESWRAALSAYAGATLLGILWGTAAYLHTPGLLVWLSPVLVGLVTAVPLAALSGRSDLGLVAKRHGWFLVPEEVAPPAELADLVAPRLATEFAPAGERRLVGTLEAADAGAPPPS